MTWLTWRLHRTEAAIGIALFVTLIVIMLSATRSVDSAYNAAQNGGCFGGGGTLCEEHLTRYFDRLSNWNQLTALLHGVPIVLAALLAIPTLQELERGSHRLAWTQSISRRRWILTRLGFAAAVAVIVAAAWAVIARDWRSSIFRGEAGTFGRDAFELSPTVQLGYALFAVALGLAAGVVVRRVIPTLAVLAVGFVAARVFTTFVLRERYRNPVEETIAAADDVGQFTAFNDRWVLDETWLTAAGDRISFQRVNQLCTPAANEHDFETFYRRCQIDNGLQYFRSYHPADRFAQFQLIETALYLGLAVGLFAFAYWWLTRRPA